MPRGMSVFLKLKKKLSLCVGVYLNLRFHCWNAFSKVQTDVVFLCSFVFMQDCLIQAPFLAKY